jgi:hypothetical protein
MRRPRMIIGAVTGLAAAAVVFGVLASTGGAAVPTTTFNMVRSSAAVAAGCVPHGKAAISITSQGGVEVMTVKATGLPASTGFDLFVIQVPDAPFGISWYQGDLTSDASGVAKGTFRGRFSTETFAVAPGTAPAPVVHTGPFPDASANPAFSPVHTFHLGLWFDSSTAAATAGCPATVTPFNGEHSAGIQVLSTRQFAQENGPLSRIKP